MTAPVLLWLRRDLRLRDQAALLAACASGPVIPVYVLDDETPRHRAMGGASRWWLHHSLARLDAALRARGSRLILRRGACAAVLPALAAECGAGAVHALRHQEPWWRNAEREVAQALPLRLHDGNYLLPPGLLVNGAGQPYRIYTPFLRALMPHMPPAAPSAAPDRIPAPERWPASDALADWGLLPVRPDWATGFAAEWTPGEEGALERLADFAGNGGDAAKGAQAPSGAAPVARYAADRDMPGIKGTSRLSPHLHFGEIAPARIWHALEGRADEGAAVFRKELVWRDYAQTIVRAFPDYGRRNGRPAFDAFPWRTGAEAEADRAAWQRGETGYPIIDAGMRQLWATGWMHNRVRMIVASFLIKHLLIDWRVGEVWFWDTLVDADYAQNVVNWQWSAGSGVDANLFVRIMAPLGQSEKFAAAAYIRRWVPELADLDDGTIHDPEAFGRRPRGYPAKIVDHRLARARALEAWESVKAR